MELLEKWMTEKKFAYRQKMAVYDFIDLFKKLISGRIPVKKMGAMMLILFELLPCALLDTPRTPYGDELDLTGYVEVFRDEFVGDAVDTSVWNIDTFNGERAHYSASQVEVKGGNLYLTGSHHDETGEFGWGWYSGGLSLKKRYCRGYFEIRCKINENPCNLNDFWSAFWLSVEGEYDAAISKGGPGGCEIDIMEAMGGGSDNEKVLNSVTPTLWCNGYDDDDSPEDLDGRVFSKYYVGDIYNEYNTYGVLWTKDEYIFYINGVEACRSSFGNGVSEVPEILRVTLSMSDKGIAHENSYKTVYTVDYVRILQLPEDIVH